MKILENLKAPIGDGVVDLHIEQYPNKRLAILLTQTNTEGEMPFEEPYMTCSVNFPEFPLASDEVAIKNWSENEGIELWLIGAGVIMPERSKSIRSGFVNAPVYKFTLGFYRKMMEEALKG